MARVLILGATGLLGRALSVELSKNHQVIRQSRVRRADIDVTVDPSDPKRLCEVVSNANPDAIINTIAVTDIDHCQRDSQYAFSVNSKIVGNIVRAIENSSIHLIQISTDHLYTRRGPQSERDIDVINMYAATKLLGETFAQAHGSSTILRTNFLGHSASPGRKSFSDWIVNSLRSRTPIRLANDLLFNPLSIRSLCSAINFVIQHPEFGVYNLGSVGSISKYDAGLTIARQLNLDSELISCVTANELVFPTPRPTDMTMDVSLFLDRFGTLPATDDEIFKAAQSHEDQ